MTDRVSALDWLLARDRDYLHDLFGRECRGRLSPQQVLQAVQGQLAQNFVADLGGFGAREPWHQFQDSSQRLRQ